MSKHLLNHGVFVYAWDVLEYIPDSVGLSSIQVLDESRNLDECLAAGVFDPLVPARIRIRLTWRTGDNEIYPIGEGVQGGRVDAVSIKGQFAVPTVKG